MSFSSTVKDELVRQESKRRHCMMAELAAIVSLSGKFVKNADGSTRLCIETDNPAYARKCFTLLKKTFNIVTETDTTNGCKIFVNQQEDAEKVFEGLKLGLGPELVSPLLIQNECCKRAFIRGAFLAAGSMSDPEKAYHLEIVCNTKPKAEQLRAAINSFELDAKIVEHKGHFVVYLKEGTQIVDMLNIMEAYVALMEMENVRILKDMRNNVNRQVNCETANLNKTVNAAMRQLEDIRYLEESGRLKELPESLREMAYIRLEHPDASLKELGELANPAIGKSGVNHRLRRLSEIAQKSQGMGGLE